MKLRLKLENRDYFKQALTFSWPAGLKSTSADASVIVIQPYGFEQMLAGKAKRVGDRGEVVINYPLVDEGRYAPKSSDETTIHSEWGMGAYRFDLKLKTGRRIVGSACSGWILTASSARSAA